MYAYASHLRLPNQSVRGAAALLVSLGLVRDGMNQRSATRGFNNSVPVNYVAGLGRGCAAARP